MEKRIEKYSPHWSRSPEFSIFLQTALSPWRTYSILALNLIWLQNQEKVFKNHFLKIFYQASSDWTFYIQCPSLLLCWQFLSSPHLSLLVMAAVLSLAKDKQAITSPPSSKRTNQPHLYHPPPPHVEWGLPQHAFAVTTKIKQLSIQYSIVFFLRYHFLPNLSCLLSWPKSDTYLIFVTGVQIKSWIEISGFV